MKRTFAKRVGLQPMGPPVDPLGCTVAEASVKRHKSGFSWVFVADIKHAKDIYKSHPSKTKAATILVEHLTQSC